MELSKTHGPQQGAASMKRTTKHVALDVHQATTVASVREESGRVIARSRNHRGQPELARRPRAAQLLRAYRVEHAPPIWRTVGMSKTFLPSLVIALSGAGT